MKDGNELYQKLRQHSGSEQFFRTPLSKRFVYTEGVQDFAQNAGGGAYWLLDILSTEPATAKHVMEQGFALVVLKVTGSKALLTIADDDNVPPLYTQEIEYTDCPEAPVTPGNPEGSWKFYLESSQIEDGSSVIVCMLPQER